jgi:hypothetical protein
MKTCMDCKIEYEIEEFPWKNKTKGWRSPRCKKCYNLWYKQYFSREDNRKKQVERVTKVNKKMIEEARIYIFEYLKQNPCIDCGESNPIVLEFDHKDPKDKSFIVSSAITRTSYVNLEIVKNEINKCEIRCANCHRIKTAKQQNYWKYRFACEVL